jgi:hypothetical protein
MTLESVLGLCSVQCLAARSFILPCKDSCGPLLANSGTADTSRHACSRSQKTAVTYQCRCSCCCCPTSHTSLPRSLLVADLCLVELAIAHRTVSGPHRAWPHWPTAGWSHTHASRRAHTHTTHAHTHSWHHTHARHALRSSENSTGQTRVR